MRSHVLELANPSMGAEDFALLSGEGAGRLYLAGSREDVSGLHTSQFSLRRGDSAAGIGAAYGARAGVAVPVDVSCRSASRWVPALQVQSPAAIAGELSEEGVSTPIRAGDQSTAPRGTSVAAAARRQR